MADIRVKFTNDERALLLRIVEQSLKEARVVNGANAPDFLKKVRPQSEEAARTLLRKLQAPAHTKE